MNSISCRFPLRLTIRRIGRLVIYYPHAIAFFPIFDLILIGGGVLIFPISLSNYKYRVNYKEPEERDDQRVEVVDPSGTDTLTQRRHANARVAAPALSFDELCNQSSALHPPPLRPRGLSLSLSGPPPFKSGLPKPRRRTVEWR